MNTATNAAVEEKPQPAATVEGEQPAPQSAEEQEADAAFADGFNSVRKNEATTPSTEKSDATPGSTPGAASTEPAQPAAAAATTATAAPAAPAKDPWEGVPAVVKERLQSLEGVAGRMRNIEGSVGGINQKLDTALATAKAAANKVGGAQAAPTEAQVTAALSDPKAWEKLKEDYPEWAGPVEKEFAAIRSTIANLPKAAAVDVDGLKKEIVASNREELAQGMAVAEERAFLRLKHPDWKATAQAPEFKAWTLHGGPSTDAWAQMKQVEQTDPARAQEIQNGFARAYPQWWADKGAAIFSDAAADALKLFDGFASHKVTAAKAEADRQKKDKRLQGAVVPTGTSAPPPSAGLDDEAAFTSGFNKVAKKR